MDKRQALLAAFLNKDTPVQVYPATVKSVEGNSCTVELLSSGLEIPGVRLVADVESPFLFTPKTGSTVLIGCIENELANAFVCQYSELESGNIKIGATVIMFDKDTVSLKNSKSSVLLNQDKATLVQDQTVLELSSGKVSVKNNAVSLKEVFDDLSNLIQNLKVVTSTGPSTALFADTIASLAAFKIKYPKLLS